MEPRHLVSLLSVFLTQNLLPEIETASEDEPEVAELLRIGKVNLNSSSAEIREQARILLMMLGLFLLIKES